MSFAHDPNNVFRDNTTDGIPSSGTHEPRKADIRAMLSERDQTLIALVAENEGLELPNLLIRYTITGGDENAIVATPNLPIPDGVGLALYSIIIEEENTGAVTINGKPLKLRSGDDLPSGYLTPGPLLFMDAGTQFHVLSYGDAEAAQAAAEAALADLLDRYLGAYADDAAATTAAGTPVVGQLYWNTTDSILKTWNGSGWVAATQAAGTITISTDTGDGGTSYTLDSSAQATNTILSIGGLVQSAGFTLVDGALEVTGGVPSGVAILGISFEIVPLGTTTADLVSFSDPDDDFDGSATVQEALEYLRVNIIGGPSAQIARPEDYGAAGDGVTNDTAAVHAALASGKPDVVGRGDYLTNEIDWTVANYPDLRRIFGEGVGILRQRAQNENILHINGITKPYVEGVNFHGIWGTGLTDQSNLNNRGILLQECERPTIRDMYATRTKWMAIQNFGSNDIVIDGLVAEYCGSALYSRGGTTASVRRVRALNSIFADSEFTIAVSLETAAGHGYGVPSGWTFDDIKVRGFATAQGVMAHSGIRCRFTNLDIADAVIAFSLNQSSFAAGADTMQYISVSDSILDCPVTLPSGYSGGNACAIVSGDFDNGTYVNNVSFSNVHCTNGNRAESLSSQGGVQVQDTRRFSWNGGSIQSSWANGMRLVRNNESFAVNGVVIDTVVAVSGTENGIHAVQTSNIGTVDGNMFKTMGTGIRQASGASVAASGNQFSSVSSNTATD